MEMLQGNFWEGVGVDGSASVGRRVVVGLQGMAVPDWRMRLHHLGDRERKEGRMEK